MREAVLGEKKAVARAQSWSAEEAGREAVDFGRVWWWWRVGVVGRREWGMVGVGEVSLHGEKCPNLALSPLRLGNNTFRRRRIEDA